MAKSLKAETLIQLLRKNKIKEAAIHFAKWQRLKVDREYLKSLSPPGKPAALENFETLIGNPKKKQVKWWRQVAEEWMNMGVAQLCLACTVRAKNIIDEGAGTSLDELITLSNLSNRAQSRSNIQTLDIIDQNESRLAGEPLKAKEERINAIFGIGRKPKIDNRLKKLAKDKDLRGLMLCMLSHGESQLNPDKMLEAWFNKSEFHAVIEIFFTTFANTPLTDLGHRFRDSLILCGRAHYFLGDHITAYACFYLALLGVPEEKADLDRAPDRAPTDLKRVARDYLKRLEWAHKFLDTPLGIHRLGSNGSYVLKWLRRNNLIGLYREYIELHRHFIHIFPRTVISRQIHQVARKLGWTFAEEPEILNHDNSGASLKELFKTVPGRIFSHSSFHYNGSPQPGILKARALKPSSPTGFFLDKCRSPKSLGGSPDHPSSPATHIHIGYKKNRTIEKAYMKVQAGAPVLAVSPEVNIGLLSSAAHQLIESGWNVLWFHRMAKNDHEFLTGDLNLARISKSGKVNPEGRRWIKDSVESKAIKEDITRIINDSILKCRDPAASKCLAALLDNLDDEAFWDGLCKASDIELMYYIQKIVSGGAGLDFKNSRSLRRAASLVDYLSHIVDAFKSALSFKMNVPSFEKQLDVVGLNGLLFELYNQQSLPAALATMLCAGSLLQTKQNYFRAIKDKELLNDWNLKLKKKKVQEPADTDEEEEISSLDLDEDDKKEQPAEEPEGDGDSSPPQTRYDESLWVKNKMISIDRENRYCFMFSGEWGLELSHLVNWFQLGNMAQEYGLMVGLHDPANKDVFRRSFLNPFKHYFVSNLPAPVKEMFETATGTPAYTQPYQDIPGKNRMLSIEKTDTKISRSELIVWPNIMSK
jgi:hypothetical protein